MDKDEVNDWLGGCGCLGGDGIGGVVGPVEDLFGGRPERLSTLRAIAKASVGIEGREG